jgi:chloramphenicol 3-O-phosphotransferase
MSCAAAHACGVCIDDKVASTYDHAIVTRAVARHELMVFGEITGAVDMKVATSRIARAAPQVSGIDRRSVRTSLAPAAFSFALDPAARTPAAAVAELQKRLQVPGATLVVLRIMGGNEKRNRN